MKYLIVIICASILTACGDSGGGSAAVEQIDLRQSCESESIWTGEWIDGSLNRLWLNPDCTGTEFYCQASFTYYKPVGGQVLIRIDSTLSKAGCLDVGEHTCSVSHLQDGPSEYLTLNCGNGNTVYIPD